MTRLGLAFASSLVVVALSVRAAAQECASPASEWVFCDDFEASADQTANLGLWDDQGLGPQNLVITTDPANVHAGARALEITAHKAQDTGGGPTKWFLPGYDQVYVRFFTRFAVDYNYLHHMVIIAASEASNKWSAYGTAGCRPSGTNFFVSNVEPFSDWGNNPPPGAWGFYTYSTDMKCDPGATCANYADPQQICDDCATKGSPCLNGLECCWGTNDISSPPVVSPLGQWVCVEARVQANQATQADGSQTLWINGAEVGQWSGIRFRTDATLLINSITLSHYVTDDVYAAGQTQETVWFDDVVVSTAPIGCGNGGSGGAGATGGSSAGGSGASSAGGKGGSVTGGSSNGGSNFGGNPSTAGKGGAANSPDDSGCGCRTPRSRDDAIASLVLLALAAAGARLRRRNRGDA